MTSEEVRYHLSLAYRALAKLKLDDLTYTHLSARVPGEEAYYIYPFGLLFQEVTADRLLKVSLNGDILEGKELQYNKTGYVMHGSIYRHRLDINAVFHIHTPPIVAVSAMQNGLLPISQWSLHFYKQVAYHEYHSLALSNDEHEDRLVKDLGDKYVMLLKHHGSITAGRTIHEAFFYTHHLQKSCETQCLALQSGQPLCQLSSDVCEKAVHDLLSFEADLGWRDWQAIQRWVGYS